MFVHQNYSLKNLNTFHIDASAKYFVEVASSEEIKEILTDKNFLSVPKLILGGGSNLLFTKNVDGLVIKNNLKGIELVGQDADYYYVKAGAGEVWHSFVMHCIANNYGGLENLSLIPGNVGAGPMQNIGAYGVEIKEYVDTIETIDLADTAMDIFTNNACKFGYRESIFKGKFKNKLIITAVTFKLNKKPKFNISYGAIEKELEAMGVTGLSLQAVSKAVCNIRSSKLPDPAVIGNAGSFFKNPEITRSNFEELQQEFPAIVGYDLENGNVKLAAGWLIEQCEWKGKTFGDAGVHKLQALVLVNYGNASGKEIFDLSAKILVSVKEKFNVTLEREVNII